MPHVPMPHMPYPCISSTYSTYSTVHHLILTSVARSYHPSQPPSQGPSYNLRTKVSEMRANHAWNAVELDNRWHLIDTMWAAGIVHNGKWRRRCDNFWWCCPPSKFLPSHFPNNHRDVIKFTLVPNPAALTMEAWSTMAAPTPPFYACGLQLESAQTHQIVHKKQGPLRVVVRCPLLSSVIAQIERVNQVG